MSYKYMSRLTHEERAATLKLAMASVSAGMGKQAATPAAFAASAIPGAAKNTLKTVAAFSLVAGVPLGAAWHALHRSSKVTRNQERDHLDRIKRYHTAANSLQNQLGHS